MTSEISVYESDPSLFTVSPVFVLFILLKPVEYNWLWKTVRRTLT
jgi:hypothetical protein